MIHKIISIKNFGKFVSPQIGRGGWNGVLEQTNVIYANNGYGKTTLSLLFRSLKGNNNLIIKKKSFHSIDKPEIILLNENKKEIKFQKGKWNRVENNIEIFDSFFVEDNVYVITIREDIKSQSFFEFLLGEESVKMRVEIDKLHKEISKLSNKRINLRRSKNQTENDQVKSDLQTKLDENTLRKTQIAKQIVDLENELIKLSQNDRNKYLDRINYYLRLFNPNLKLVDLLSKRSVALYTLQISGHLLNPKEHERYSMKYSFSEGDKNALALSFYLAKLELIPDLSEYTVVIDDPMTSFDYSRKTTTINNLVAISSKVKMFILLTHDLVFANDFSRRVNYVCNNLKIENNGTTSFLAKHDIEKESLTGVFKDLTVLHEYLQNGASNDFERREVARCIRPVLEGIFRIKFFKEITGNEWLGDIISKIRLSDANSNFYRYKPEINELIEINDYSKEYHHSNPYTIETPMNDSELRGYVNRTIELLRRI